ncbi:hypothetical protein EYF80_003515 [Liparis tanakae]|uniref:Uncharacterized protein n=1 Tax=Liparis tanakae TaxID=230148 RepID=A0A4Z2J8S4_9TELE|nr:hypothetical protein EYF80_003515 [Liparis tanakae]
MSHKAGGRGGGRSDIGSAQRRSGLCGGSTVPPQTYSSLASQRGPPSQRNPKESHCLLPRRRLCMNSPFSLVHTKQSTLQDGEKNISPNCNGSRHQGASWRSQSESVAESQNLI